MSVPAGVCDNRREISSLGPAVSAGFELSGASVLSLPAATQNRTNIQEDSSGIVVCVNLFISILLQLFLTAHYSNESLLVNTDSIGAPAGVDLSASSDLHDKESKEKKQVKKSNCGKSSKKRKVLDEALLESSGDLSDEDFVKKKRKHPLPTAALVTLSSEENLERRKPMKPNCRKTPQERKLAIEAAEKRSQSDENFSEVHVCIMTLYD